MAVQLGFWESLMALFCVKPILLSGILVVALVLYLVIKNDSRCPRIRTIAGSLLLYYYCCIMFWNVVGIPTLGEFARVSSLGEPIFNPKLNFIPFNDGFSLSFILNVCLFMPLGFLAPVISKTYCRARNTVLLGFVLSLAIEISQLFTLYRATDINDLLTNTLGAYLGYLVFRATVRSRSAYRKDLAKYLPGTAIAAAFVVTFLN